MKNIYMECTLYALMNQTLMTEQEIHNTIRDYNFKSVRGVKYFVLLENGGKEDNTPVK